MRAAQHPQWWCDECNGKGGPCRGEHFTHTRVGSIGGVYANTESSDEYATVPYADIGATWNEWQPEYCLPAVYLAVSGSGSMYLDLASAEELRNALDEAVKAIRETLSAGHILCTCAPDEVSG